MIETERQADSQHKELLLVISFRYIYAIKSCKVFICDVQSFRLTEPVMESMITQFQKPKFNSDG